MQWAVLIFMGAVALGSMGLAWRARGILAANELEIANLKIRYDQVWAALSNALQDRNFLVKYDLADISLRADLDHLRNNFRQHQDYAGHMHDDVIRLQSEVARLGKLINGKN